jgi:NADH:ubiquinone oxidoreductase subunit K
MNGQIFGMLIMIFMGALPCIILGYLVAVKQKRGLIAGWDESKIAHPEAYAKWIGYSVIVLGVLIAIIAISWSFRIIDDTVMTLLLAIASMVPVPCLIIANAKYR